MNGTLIATTARGNMHPLAYQGILATDCHHQIVSILRSRLGDGHVLLFAEPAFDPSRDIVDWYSPVQGTPVRMVDLPADRQDTVRATLIKMAADIQTQAQQLKNTGDNNRMLSGSIIALALQYPSDDCIYLVGEQPVLVCWGFGPATAGAKPQDLARLASLSPRKAPPPRPAVSEPTPPQPAASVTTPLSEPLLVPGGTKINRRFPWWLFFLLGLALLLVLLWLFFGKKLEQRFFPVPEGLAITAPTDTDGLEAAIARGQQLRRERDELLTALAEKAAQCQKPPVQADVQHGTELQVPENAGQGSDLSFLQGVWRCDSDLSTPRIPWWSSIFSMQEARGRSRSRPGRRSVRPGRRPPWNRPGRCASNPTPRSRVPRVAPSTASRCIAWARALRLPARGLT